MLAESPLSDHEIESIGLVTEAKANIARLVSSNALDWGVPIKGTLFHSSRDLRISKNARAKVPNTHMGSQESKPSVAAKRATGERSATGITDPSSSRLKMRFEAVPTTKMKSSRVIISRDESAAKKSATTTTAAGNCARPLSTPCRGTTTAEGYWLPRNGWIRPSAALTRSRET